MPDSAARLLANAPLVFVIAAIRFESLEALPSWMAEIQDDLRDRMPLYRRIRQSVSQAGFEVAIDPPDFDAQHASSAWIMSTVDGLTSAQFAKGALIVHTRSYHSFVEFAEVVRLALEALLMRAKRIYVGQVGIRYLDHLRAANGDGVDKFVSGQLLPHVPNMAGLSFRNAVSTTTYNCGSHLLNVRFGKGAGMPVIPEDLMPAYLSSSKLSPSGIISFDAMKDDEGVLDTDCTAADLGPQVMDQDQILALLDELHVTANSYFRSVTTEHATDAWGGGIKEGV